jgi:integrase
MGVRVKSWKGAWWIFINHEGRRKAKRCASKKAAELAADKIDAALRLGQTEVLEASKRARPDRAPTFKEYAERWLETHVRLACKGNTHALYRSRLELHWYPTLGAVLVSAITRDQIRGRVAELLAHGNLNAKAPRGLRAGTTKAVLIPLRSCLSAAVEDGLLPANPAMRIGRAIKTGTPEEGGRSHALTADELELVLSQAEADIPEAYPLLLTLARTGMRQGEALGLRVGDVDLAQHAIWIRRTWYRGLLNTPKSGRARRVDMSQQLEHALRGWIELRAAEAVVAGRGLSAEGWLFPAAGSGEPADRRWLASLWHTLLRRSGLRQRPPHALRHTYASLLISRGVSLAYVRDQLGHSSIQVTVDVYGHLVPGGQRAVADTLDSPTFRNPRATAEDLSASTVPVSR